jgi:hypothetical protein
MVSGKSACIKCRKNKDGKIHTHQIFYPLQLTYAGQTLTVADNIKFLELQLDNHLT